jgi:hypothetical protein
MASDHKSRGLRSLETLLSLLMHPKPEDTCLEMCRCDGIGRAERYAEHQPPRNLRTSRDT